MDINIFFNSLNIYFFLKYGILDWKNRQQKPFGRLAPGKGNPDSFFSKIKILILIKRKETYKKLVLTSWKSGFKILSRILKLQNLLTCMGANLPYIKYGVLGWKNPQQKPLG